MLAGLMLERMMPSGYCTVCTLIYAMLVVMYLHKCRPLLKPCERKERHMDCVTTADTQYMQGLTQCRTRE